MMQHYMFGIFMLLTCTFLEVSTYPSKSESSATVEDSTQLPETIGERSLAYDETNIENEDVTRDILEKITAINEALKKPHRKYTSPWYPNPPQINTGNVLDEDILKKLQQVIASGKLHSHSNNIKREVINNINDESPEIIRYSRQISPVFTNNAISPMPIPYVTNMPVLIMPNTNNVYGQRNSIDVAAQYQTKEGPSFSFQPFQFLPQLQTPFAGLFPILLRDPFVSALSGASFLEYGQSADVCKRHQKSERNGKELTENDDLEIPTQSSNERKSREKRAIKKRTVNHKSQLQEIDKVKKFFSLASSTAKPNKKESHKIINTSDEGDEDLRFSFLLGQKDKPPNGPGFFINRLKVRKGGVAIAGPGGVATAGHGGTAIVGPGGLAYTQPGGIAVAGPAARVIALSPDADLTSVAHRLQQQSTIDGSVSELLHAIPEGKHVATDPTEYENGDAMKRRAKKNLEINNKHSHTMETSVYYLPFYGGAKGQYLEIKKDSSGKITSEKIVSEENISSENIIKVKDENLLAKVLAANLLNLKTLSTNLLKTTNLGRKTGSLASIEKEKYKSQLASLGEAASNIIKLIDELEDVDVLFKRNVTLKNRDDGEDNVSEEGVGIDASGEDITGDDGEPSLIAEAKPVGLAIVGEHGIAASRPMATAVAASGIAIARPIATAIAGIDPSVLNIEIKKPQDYAKKS